MRKAVVLGILAFIFSGIALILWEEEFRYALPTPVPVNYQEVAVGTCIDLEELLAEPAKRRFVHFFNPECPCSRFNAAHFNYLYKEYHKDIDFLVIIPDGASHSRTREILNDELPIYEDQEEKWSKLCGVYASPQAVIIDQNSSLYYRGNYNKARFCTFPGSNYAEISLNLLLRGSVAPVWDFYATRSYGCQLPEADYGLSSLFLQSFQKQTSPTLWNAKNSYSALNK